MMKKTKKMKKAKNAKKELGEGKRGRASGDGHLKLLIFYSI